MFSLATVAELKPLAKVVLALLSRVLLAYFARHRWSSWNETIAAVAFTMGICFLAAVSLGGAIQGRGRYPRWSHSRFHFWSGHLSMALVCSTSPRSAFSGCLRSCLQLLGDSEG
jgi:hypothetical protein